MFRCTRYPYGRSTQADGFQVTLGNGFVFSVQWHYEAYCDNRTVVRALRNGPNAAPPCANAEVGLIHADGDFLDVAPYCTPDEVACLMAWASGLHFRERPTATEMTRALQVHHQKRRSE